MRALLIILTIFSSVLAVAQTPEQVVQSYANAVNAKDINAAAKYVNGGALSSFSGQMMPSEVGHFTLSKITSTIIGNYAFVTFEDSIREHDATAEHLEHGYLVLVKSGSTWLIDVPDHQDLAFLAFSLSPPPSLLIAANRSAHMTMCLSNLKQLDVALQLLMGDNDDKIAVTKTGWTTEIQPYIKGAKLLTCPDDKPGVTSYSINENLIGKVSSEIADPAGTVLIYEGANHVLNFRHNGRAAVGFADGHCKMVNAEESKKLKWAFEKA